MKTRYIIPLILSAIIISACEDILEVKPANAINSQNAITDSNSALAALRGMYSSLQSDAYYGQYMVVWPDLAADNLKHTGTFSTNNEVDANHILASNTTIAAIWASIYRSISLANYILKYVPLLPDISAKEKSNLRGQAFFIRALGYSNLVKMFGGVPIILEPVTSLSEVGQPGRTTVDEVYTRIMKDLDAALANLPVPVQGSFKVPIVNGMAGYYAALALKARVALYKGDYSAAMICADSVIRSGLYSTDISYFENFDYRNPYSDESIFEVDFTSQDANSLAFWFFYDAFGGRYEYAPTQELVSAYDSTDDRFWANLYFYQDELNNKNGWMGVKYTDIATGSDNVIVIRLAEMYLIRAESNLNGIAYPDPFTLAEDDVNLIRRRSGADPYDRPVTLDDILNELRLEFAFEGHRWFDLTRMNKAEKFLPTVTSKDQYLWPIPQRERDVNPNLGQNPGY